MLYDISLMFLFDVESAKIHCNLIKYTKDERNGMSKESKEMFIVCID